MRYLAGVPSRPDTVMHRSPNQDTQWSLSLIGAERAGTYCWTICKPAERVDRWASPIHTWPALEFRKFEISKLRKIKISKRSSDSFRWFERQSFFVWTGRSARRRGAKAAREGGFGGCVSSEAPGQRRRGEARTRRRRRGGWVGRRWGENGARTRDQQIKSLWLYRLS